MTTTHIPLPTPVPLHTATPVTHTVAHSSANALTAFASVFGGMPFIITLAVVVLVFLGVIMFLKKRGSLSCDLYMLDIDEVKNTITLRCLEKLHGNVYISYGHVPSIVSIPKDMKTYTIKVGNQKVKGILGYTYGYLAVPLDPDLASAISVFSNSNKYAEIDDKSIDNLIASLYKLEKNVNGKIIIPPSFKIVMAFRIHKIMRDIIYRVLRRAQISVMHINEILHQSEAFSKYVMALSQYRASKYGWIKYVILGMIVISVILFMFVGH